MSEYQNKGTREDRMRALSPQQREWLQRRLAESGLAGNMEADAAAPAAALASSRPALTPAQQQLWVTARLQPDSSAYHIAWQWELSGTLHLTAFSEAWKALIQRHAVLRTAFPDDEGQPYQQVLAHADCPLSHQPAPGSNAARERQIEEFVSLPFALEQAPLLRVLLLREEERQHRLILVLHHLIADGWSRGVLLRELADAYRAAVEGRALDWQPLPLHYTDYARLQQEWLQTAECRRQTDYWRKQLSGIGPLALGRVDERRRVNDYRARTLKCRLPPALGRELQAAGRRLGATPFMLLLTAFNLLLHRYSGRADIAVGIPLAGRYLPTKGGSALDLGAMIGFFVNTLVIRTRPDCSHRLEAWLTAVKQTVADAFDHGDLPFAKVVDAVGARRENQRTPLFDIMFQYQSDSYRQQNAETLDNAFPGLSVRQQGLELTHTKFDMTWHVLDRESGLWLVVEYRTALYDQSFVEQMLQHYENLLGAILHSDGNTEVGSLLLLTAAEADRIAAWQRAPELLTTPIHWASLIDRFETSVASHASAVAVACSGYPGWSYDQLNREANRLARRLQALSIGEEDLVGVCLPRQPDLMVALLAVMKAGAAYLPLDPALPPERLRYMVDDANIPLLVCDGPIEDHGLFENIDCRLLVIDAPDERDARAALADDNLAVVLHPQQLAYVIYTSGSSGRPKGTLLTHGGLMHYLNWCQARYPLTSGMGSPVNSSIGFDATITALFTPLLCGRTVTLLTASDSLAALARALNNRHSLVKLTPAHLTALQPLVEDDPPIAENLPAAFVIGGEALSEAHVAFWRERFPKVQLINEYGPTETVVGCCYYRATPEDQGSIPIGRPISGAKIYLLDAYLNPVPLGVVGEIYIGGHGMARGYLHRPALTAERFLPDPFSGSESAAPVMYRTGDLAVFNADGMLVYLGRADQQLQLRGYRIEAGEVESALCRLPEIAEAVVIVAAQSDVAALIAYLRLTDATAVLPDDNELRRRLGQWLPSYMLPAQFLVLDRFPLTANGKIDRDRLPRPSVKSSDAIDPENRGEDLDNLLLEVWSEVLQRTDIGRNDNFFELGGDSVAAMQIVAKLRRQGFELSPDAIFDHQTVAAQVALLRPLSERQTSKAVGVAELAPAQWDFFQRVESGAYPQPNHFNQSVLLDIADDVSVDILEQALQQLAERYDALRLRFRRSVADDGRSVRWEQYYSDEPPKVPLLVADRTAGGDAALLIHTQCSLDIGKGPLFRALLLSGEQGGRGLLLAAHHLIIDGVSWRLLLTDLNAAYSALRAGETLPLSAPPPFATWTRALSAASFDTELSYWQAAIRPAKTFAGGNTAYTEAQSEQLVVVSDQPDACERLAAAASVLDASADEILLTALVQTLSQWLKSETIAVDVEGHGRQAIAGITDAMSATIGWFTAAYPLRLVLPVAAPSTQLTAVKQIWRSVPRHGIGYGVLRMQGRLPTPSPAQVRFNYLGRLELADYDGIVRGLANAAPPQQRCPSALRCYVLEVDIWQRDGRLHWLFRYVPDQIAAAIVVHVAHRSLANFQSLLAMSASDAAEPNSTTVNRQ